MPNWCENILTVSDKTPEFVEFMKGGIDFQKIKPCPYPDSDTTGAWYQWCVDNWGTKWNAANDEETNFADDDYIRFTTAWSPPIAAIQELAAKFPTMKFTLKYFEGGMFFGGIVELSNGQITLDEELADDELQAFAVEEFGYDETELDEDEEEFDDFEEEEYEKDDDEFDYGH
jgi:hypothetical protein